ncbi:gamma-glutamyltranspeptidase [Hyaloraphidium curvatum]|nr:gamma-glutamyltranspeptidase [Hyaloraphidium curvatum]
MAPSPSSPFPAPADDASVYVGGDDESLISPDARPPPPSPSRTKGVWRLEDESKWKLSFGVGLLLLAGGVFALALAFPPPGSSQGTSTASSASSFSPPPADLSGLPSTHWRLPFRPPSSPAPGIISGDVVEASHGVVVSESKICSEMGAGVLKDGGNAVDAGVAVATCLGVTGSFFSGAGGGGFMTIRTPSGKSQTINFREAAPSSATRDMFNGHEKEAQLGGKAAGIPGEFAGLHKAHTLHGRLPWSSLLLPSANLSTAGFPVTPQLSLFLNYFGDAVLQSDLARIFAPEGKVLGPGDTVRRPEYGRLLERIAAEGPDAFYRSELTRAMVDYLNSAGGGHRAEDWASFEAELQESMAYDFRGGFRVHTAPPPASGPVLLSILSILAEFPPLQGEPDKETMGKEWQRVVEGFKWSYAWRGLLGDPGKAPDYEFIPNIRDILDEATDKKRAGKIKSKISDTETHEPDYYHPKFDPKEMPGTTHFSIIDREGWAVAMTSTVNLLWGNRMVEPTTGVIFNNEMDDFSFPGVVNNGSQSGLPPSPANYIEPGKRPLSASAPAIVELLDRHGRPHDVYLAIGGAGGSRITTAVAQVLLDVLDRNIPAKDAVLRPRVHHQLYPNKAMLEPHSAPALADYLRLVGHEVQVLPPEQHLAVVSAVQKVGRKISGAGDPRGLDGGAAGWDGSK